MTPTSRTALILCAVVGTLLGRPTVNRAQESVPTPPPSPPPAVSGYSPGLSSGGATTYGAPAYSTGPTSGPSSFSYGSSDYSSGPTGYVIEGSNRTYTYGSADWLFTTRTHAFDTPVQITNGPDALSFKSVPITYKSGYRLRLGVSACDGWGIEGVYNDLGNWSNTRTDTITTGLAFDNGVQAGNPWAGANSIDGNTFFAPVSLASVLGNPVDETSEFEGLGPNTAFADPTPTYTLSHQSNFWTTELNFLNHEWNGRVQYGFGYLHAQLTENALASITGTFRAADAGIGIPNAGLADASLTNPLGGGLTLISGTADGWNDETNPALGPDRLTFTHTASTQNYMNGGQGVLKILVTDGPRFTLDVTGKGGVYHNRVRGVVQERYSGLAPLDNSVYGRDFTSTNDVVSFLGLTGVNGA
ncbi:MAG: hypothetical protein JNM18_07585, partial [Planctomycetaceae bacterium]|nr:hypothetical protein [Planctomycetaceae bacterium]